MVRDCTACKLRAGCTQTVFGVGDEKADWLFVGEGPGADEDAQGEPFVGQAGKLLDNMLLAIKLKRGKNVYIANIVKCRPPDNRTPEAGRDRDLPALFAAPDRADSAENHRGAGQDRRQHVAGTRRHPGFVARHGCTITTARRSSSPITPPTCCAPRRTRPRHGRTCAWQQRPDISTGLIPRSNLIASGGTSTPEWGMPHEAERLSVINTHHCRHAAARGDRHADMDRQREPASA